MDLGLAHGTLDHMISRLIGNICLLEGGMILIWQLWLMQDVIDEVSHLLSKPPEDGQGGSTERYLKTHDFYRAVPEGAIVHQVTVKYPKCDTRVVTCRSNCYLLRNVN